MTTSKVAPEPAEMLRAASSSSIDMSEIATGDALCSRAPRSSQWSSKSRRRAGTPTSRWQCDTQTGLSVWTSESTSNSGKLKGKGDADAFVGVQQRSLPQLLASGWYRGCVVRKVEPPLSEAEAARLVEFTEARAGKMAYEQDNIELVTSAVDCYCCGTDVCRDRRDLPASRRRDSQFCSEYAVHAYDAAGRLGTAALKEQVAMAHEIVPVDFATGGAFDGLRQRA